MMMIARSALALLLGMTFVVTVAGAVSAASSDRSTSTTAKRLRNPNQHATGSLQSSTSLINSDVLPYDTVLKALTNEPVMSIVNVMADHDGARLLQQHQDGYDDVMMEVFDSLVSSAAMDSMSMAITMSPTATPQHSPPSTGTPGTQSPSAPTDPTATSAPMDPTTLSPSSPPAVPSPTGAPVIMPTPPPNDTVIDTVAPTGRSSSAAPVVGQTDSPVVLLGSDFPSQSPSTPPTAAPTLSNCPGITQAERIAQILTILDAVANPIEIRDGTIPQGKATEWLLDQDLYQICPDADKLIQRWSMAVIYHSTGGDDWFQCSANGVDNCGRDNPFHRGEDRFLAASSECEWAGVACMNGSCVTAITFEENNLVGTIPTEIGLLSTLTIWGMERGMLTSTIPTEVGRLTNLTFIDLDYNQLTGTLTTELYSLIRLTQLDLNNNRFTGNIHGMTDYPMMEFLQLHDNLFTGSIPPEIGQYKNLTTLTVHESLLSGDMPVEVCDLTVRAGKGGVWNT